MQYANYHVIVHTCAVECSAYKSTCFQALEECRRVFMNVLALEHSSNHGRITFIESSGRDAWSRP